MEIKLVICGKYRKLDECCDGKKLGLKGESERGERRRERTKELKE